MALLTVVRGSGGLAPGRRQHDQQRHHPLGRDGVAAAGGHLEPAGDVQYAESHFVSGVKHLPIEYAFR